MLKKLLVLTAALAFYGESARAEVTALPQLETNTIQTVFDTLAASLAFKPAEGASELGNLWGLSLGVGVAMTDLSALTSLGATTSTAYLPSGDIQIALGIKSLTFEAGMIPTLAVSGNTFSRFGAALKWTANRTLLKKFPLSVAARALYSKASIGYTQTDGTGTVDVDYSASQFGAQLVTSKFLGGFGFGIEPYVGIGFLNQSSTISATGTGDLFGSSYSTGTTSVSGNGLGLWLQAGLMLRLGILGFSAEYDQLYGQKGFAGKVAFRF